MNKQYCSNHATDRALERYGFKINEAKAKRIVDKIKKGRCKKIYQCDYSKAVYLVNFRSKDFVLIYSPITDIIVTFLPIDNLYTNNKLL